MGRSAFRNERKSKDGDADYNGSGKVGGVEFWVNGWINESKKDGKKYLRVRLKPKVEKREPVTLTKGRYGAAIDDEVIF